MTSTSCKGVPEKKKKLLINFGDKCFVGLNADLRFKQNKKIELIIQQWNIIFHFKLATHLKKYGKQPCNYNNI